MEVPVSFKQLTRVFYASALEDAKNLDELVDRGLAAVDHDKLGPLADYLEGMLSPPVDEKMLQKLWWGSAAGLYFLDAGDLVKVLTAVKLRAREISNGS